MENYEGTQAVRTARMIASAIAIIFTIIGGFTAFWGFVKEPFGVRWDMVAIGFAVLGTGVSFFIVKGFLRGMESITKASEIYIDQMEDDEDSINEQEDDSENIEND